MTYTCARFNQATNHLSLQRQLGLAKVPRGLFPLRYMCKKKDICITFYISYYLFNAVQFEGVNIIFCVRSLFFTFLMCHMAKPEHVR